MRLDFLFVPTAVLAWPKPQAQDCLPLSRSARACSGMSSLFGFGKKKATAPPPPPSQPPPRSVAGAQSAPRSENAMTITKIRDMLESLDKREAHLMRKVWRV